MRRWSVVVSVLVVAALAAGSTAQAVNLDGDFTQCMTCIDGLKRQLAHVSLLGNLFTVVGAAMAAIGSIVAGASNGGKKSWIAGIIGVVGAVVTAMPKTLPDRADIQRRISLADQHRVSGEKTMRQLALISDPAATTEWEKYAISRFIDCSAAEPAKDVPEAPSSKGPGPAFVAAVETRKKDQAGAGAAARPAKVETLHGQAVAAVEVPTPARPPVAAAPPPVTASAEPAAPPELPAQHIFKTRQECQILPNRYSCIRCMNTTPEPHYFDSTAKRNEGCKQGTPP